MTPPHEIQAEARATPAGGVAGFQHPFQVVSGNAGSRVLHGQEAVGALACDPQRDPPPGPPGSGRCSAAVPAGASCSTSPSAHGHQAAFRIELKVCLQGGPAQAFQFRDGRAGNVRQADRAQLEVRAGHAHETRDQLQAAFHLAVDLPQGLSHALGHRLGQVGQGVLDAFGLQADGSQRAFQVMGHHGQFHQEEALLLVLALQADILAFQQDPGRVSLAIMQLAPMPELPPRGQLDPQAVFPGLVRQVPDPLGRVSLGEGPGEGWILVYQIPPAIQDAHRAAARLDHAAQQGLLQAQALHHQQQGKRAGKRPAPRERGHWPRPGPGREWSPGYDDWQ
jgi:hypothetical protein